MIKYRFESPRQLLGHGWYVAVKGSSMYYLHRDGEVRAGTARGGDVDGQRSGYFLSELEASLAIVRRIDQQDKSK